jgi:glycosyltransferase involved in cell wall biosynthesis
VDIIVKRVLMVAYHFPPMNQSSGIQRTLRFAQYLPGFNWEPIVLTAHPRAYPSVSSASVSDIPVDLRICRAFALDAAKHLSIRGVYPRWLTLPDRWLSWWLGAVPAGLALIRKLKPDVLWSTHPIPTAHLIGYTLHRLTGIPWVADFRDPMAEPGEPEKVYQHDALVWIEQKTLARCQRAVFTTPGAVRYYAERYPDIPSSRLTVIENGYDECAFADAEQIAKTNGRNTGPIVLLHSGIVYPSARDPRAFFAALGQLRENGAISAELLKIVLRATGCDDYIRDLVQQYGIEDIVVLAPQMPYRSALAEMLSVDGLLLLQAANCNYQVPAKLYEYLRAGRPVLALTDPAGDTASALRNAGINTIASLDSQNEISELLLHFLELVRERRAPIATDAAVAAASRRVRTAELAGVLDATSAA